MILNQPHRNALLARYAYRVTRSLDIAAMRAAAAHLVGEHDFRSFVRVLPETVTTRRVARLEVDRREELVRISIAADGFLHRMVRTIVGTLIECGSGRRDPDAMPAILARPRSLGGRAIRPRLRDSTWRACAMRMATTRSPSRRSCKAGREPILDADRAFP